MTIETVKPIAEFSNKDGNVFHLMAICNRALRQAGYTQEQMMEFQVEVMNSTTYDGAIQVMMKWCDVQ